MRKLISMLLLLLIIFCNTTYAEGIDIASMSLEEIVELHKMIDAEIDARISCEESLIPSGVYVAGKSIKSGSYVLSGNDDHFGIDIATYASEETFKQSMAEDDDSLILFESYVTRENSAFVKLEDGMVLYLEETLLIEKATADWML